MYQLQAMELTVIGDGDVMTFPAVQAAGPEPAQQEHPVIPVVPVGCLPATHGHRLDLTPLELPAPQAGPDLDLPVPAELGRSPLLKVKDPVRYPSLLRFGPPRPGV